jgi:hypothetical protein
VVGCPALTSDREPSRNEIIGFARDALGFLADAAGAKLEVKDGASQTVLAYVVGPLTYEVELDWRERVAVLLVCRTIDGHRPPGYYTHGGERVRVHLAQALSSGDEDDRRAAERLRSAPRGSGGDAMKTQIMRLASALRDAIDHLPSYMDSIFQ